MHARDWARRQPIAPDEEHPKYILVPTEQTESKEKKALTGMLLARNQETKEKGNEVVPSALTTVAPGGDGDCYQYVNGELNPEWVAKYGNPRRTSGNTGESRT